MSREADAMAQFRFISPGSATIGGHEFQSGATTEVSDGEWRLLRRLRQHPSFVEIDSSPPGTRPGPPGPEGSVGPKGDTGETGAQGAASTVPGPAGSAGATGPQGAKGDTGDAGAIGPTGAQGATGLTGLQGPTGAKGDAGAAGATGPQGIQGDTGDAGAQGIQGLTGNAGPQGNTGQQGIQGVAGVDGVRTATTAFGYSTGAGGTVTQATSKATAVTLNKLTGEITMNAAALAAGAIATFVLNNNQLAVGDMIVASHHSGGTVGPYIINGRVTGAGAGSFAVRNTSAGSLSEALVIKFATIKTVAA